MSKGERRSSNAIAPLEGETVKLFHPQGNGTAPRSNAAPYGAAVSERKAKRKTATAISSPAETDPDAVRV
jgi:hypothetical protein